MRIAIVAPLNIPELSMLLGPSDSAIALEAPQSSATAPTRIGIELWRRGHAIDFVTHGDGLAPLRLAGDRVSVTRVASRSRGRHRFKDLWRVERAGMLAAIHESGADVVSAHWAYEHAQAALSSGLPTAVTVRDAPATVLRYAPDFQRLIKYGIAVSTSWRSSRAAVAAVSPYMAETWRRQTVSRGRIDIVPNPSPTVTTGNDMSPVPLITEVADDGPRKNVIGLLRAFRLVRREIPTAELQIIGRGLGAGEPVSMIASREGLATGVHFMGTLPPAETRRQLARSWVHAHASREESLGNTLLEAMAIGTAVIGGSNSGAVPWVLDHGRAGILSDVDDPINFASSIVTVLSDATLRVQVETAAKVHLERTFSTDRVIQQYLDLFARAIETGR